MSNGTRLLQTSSAKSATPRALRQKHGWGPMRGFVAAAQGRRSNEGRTDERHFVDAIATLLATTDGDEDEDMWQFANNGPLYWTKRDCSPLVPQSPALFLPFFLSSPEANLLSFSFPRMHCSLSLCLSRRDCISKHSGFIVPSVSGVSADNGPLSMQIVLSGGLLSRQPEHAGTRLIKLGNIPPHSLMFIPHSWA